MVVCLYDAATKLAQEVVGDLRTFLEKSRGLNVPWAAARVFDTKIRRNIKLAECPSFGQSIFGYAPNCPGAVDYAALAAEVNHDNDFGLGISDFGMKTENRSDAEAEPAFNPQSEIRNPQSPIPNPKLAAV